ncbi:MAG TPA: cytidine deaminase [Terriglobia bacterium]|nr:cytidine deaminase [Terriglobia bacterium]
MADSVGQMSRRRALSMLALAYPMGTAIGPEGDSLQTQRLNSAELRKLMPSLSAPSQDRLLAVLNDSSLRGQIPASEVEAVASVERASVDQLMLDLLPIAQLRSLAPLSHYHVGAVVRGTSGSLYLGANLEVPGHMLGLSVHAEQSAVANAFMHDEGGLTSIAITAAPCGHCRQFLNELSNAPGLTLIIKGSGGTGRAGSAKLPALLPAAFGPNELGVAERLFNSKKVDLELIAGVSDELTSAALGAAAKSYAPYTKAHSGVALIASSKTVYAGSYIENVAFNPSLSPLQAALVGLIMGDEEPGRISSVVLVELEGAAISQLSATQAVLEGLAPAARLRRVTARLRK